MRDIIFVTPWDIMTDMKQYKKIVEVMEEYDIDRVRWSYTSRWQAVIIDINNRDTIACIPWQGCQWYRTWNEVEYANEYEEIAFELWKNMKNAWVISVFFIEISHFDWDVARWEYYIFDKWSFIRRRNYKYMYSPQGRAIDESFIQEDNISTYIDAASWSRLVNEANRYLIERSWMPEVPKIEIVDENWLISPRSDSRFNW